MNEYYADLFVIIFLSVLSLIAVYLSKDYRWFCIITLALFLEFKGDSTS